MAHPQNSHTTVDIHETERSGVAARLRERLTAPPLDNRLENLDMATTPPTAQAQPRRLPTLRVMGGKDMLQFVTLMADEELIIGREETGGLVLSDASVSRRHARVMMSKDQQVMVSDLGSTNGTAISPDPILKGPLIHQAPLPPGAILEIGGVALQYELLSLEQVAHLERVVGLLWDHDTNTGFLPTTWLEETLPSLLQTHATRNRPLSAVLFELDKLDAFRPRLGELSIQEIVYGAGRLVLWKVRSCDFCIQLTERLGLLILPGANLEQGSRVSERLRREVSTYRWPRPIAGHRINLLTGLAEWDGQESMGAWIQRAQAALTASQSRPR